MSTMKQRILTSLVALPVLVLAACSQDAQVPQTPFVSEAETTDVTEVVQSEAAVITELASPSGSTLVFIDESTAVEGGGVGILERTSEGQGAVLPTLESSRPTALEVFGALAPGKAAPARLLEAHAAATQRRGSAEAQPRHLQTSGLTGSLDLEWCRSPDVFKDRFHSWFGLGYAHEGYGLGLIWNKIGTTGVASRRVLAACNNPLATPFAPATPVEVKVEAQVGANLWVLVGGTNLTIGNAEGMYYISEGMLAQRYRIVANGHPWAIYNLAGAWGGASPSSQ